MSRPIGQNRSSPGSSIGLSQSLGALSDASAGIAHVVRGLLRSGKGGLSRISWGVFGRQPAAVRGCRLVAECGLVCGWGICGSCPYDVAFGVCESLLRQCLPSGDCNFSCTQIGYNPGCLDARSSTLHRCCPGVGRSGGAETYVTDYSLEGRSIWVNADEILLF